MTPGSPSPARGVRRAFTLVELSIVLALLGILALIVVPGGVEHTRRAREATLRQQLAAMRDQIDKFRADQKRFPASLEELVEKGYLRAVPTDPFTGSARTWRVAPSEPGESDVYEVRSGATERARDGSALADF